MYIRRPAFMLSGVFALLLLLYLIFGTGNIMAAESPLASVNGSIISSKELEWETKQLAIEMRLRNQPLNEQQIRQLRNDLIENLIDRELLYQHAQSKQIQIRPQWVDAALSEFKGKLGGNSALQSFLTEADLSQMQLKERLAKGLTVQRLLRREPVQSIKVSEAEIQAFYRNHKELFQQGEEIRVKHIFVAVNDMNDENRRTEGLEKIKALKARIDQGANFAVLALEYSDCPSKTRSGDLGYLTRDQLTPSFAAAAFELAPDAVSDIVTTRFGYHLIKMIDRRPPSTVAYAEVRDKIERTLRRDKENDAVTNYINKLKRQSEIRRYNDKN
ncbi:MAG: peptidylprolyl isomerase [Desulfobacteraceae bacterium]|nr:peptidylprolyl isomerase [Desulfobacteraceae bacterium]